MIALPGRVPLKLAAAAIALVLLAFLIGDRNRWKSKTERYAALLSAECAAHGATVANYRAAAERARREDAENLARVRASQAAINERTRNEFESRIAAARASAATIASGRLQRQLPPPEPIPAVAEQRVCPAFPLPPAELLKPPAKTDFLNPTG